jgi:hypothetical protein
MVNEKLVSYKKIAGRTENSTTEISTTVNSTTGKLDNQHMEIRPHCRDAVPDRVMFSVSVQLIFL